MKRQTLLLIVLFLFALGTLGAAWAGSSANYAIQPSVVASGGTAASSANYAINSTVGQTAIGQGTSANYALCSGFWCRTVSALQELFLPLAQR